MTTIEISFNELKINESSNINKTIIYSRVSTNDQNFNRQITCCSNYCNENKFKIIDVVSESCTAYKNPVQSQLLNIINNNSYINIVIEEPDRLSRNAEYAIKLLDMCFKKNIIIYILNKKYIIENNKSLNYNNLINDIKYAENDSKLKSERIKFANKLKKIKKINPFIINLILKLKYGSYKKDIDNLILKIKGFPLLLNLDEIILYGNYSNEDIVLILNENNILNDNKKWSSYSINNVLNNNSNYINNLEKLTNDLLIEIYKKLNNNNVNLNYDYIFKLLTQIHYHNMSDSILNLKNILNENILSKKYIWDDFLNKYNINFRIWNYEKEVTKYGYNNI
jgi:DNA invertase Pin-like site-specific DNA recombinase